MGPEKIKQMDRRDAVLRDIKKNGGTLKWSELNKLGHHFSTVMSCARIGYVTDRTYQYDITEAGLEAIA